MSEALDYLKAVRPEAVEAYFTFLKKSGEHLDPKTRSLISVITKIDNQTEAGFRQYLTRALREGANANEIIDAILVAFPTLGLSKIVWAIDLIREMDLPEFYPEHLNENCKWHEICDVSSISEKTNYFQSDDRAVFVYKSDDNYKVYDSRCPHQQTNIPQLALEENCLLCPKHQWKFDLKTGQCIDKGDRPLKELQHKIENDKLLAYW